MDIPKININDLTETETIPGGCGGDPNYRCVPVGSYPGEIYFWDGFNVGRIPAGTAEGAVFTWSSTLGRGYWKNPD